MMQYFESFKNYAFRLEILQKYDVEEELDMYLNFQKTGKLDPSPEWISIIQNAKNRGATMSRVHIIDYPLTDYMKFELAGYKLNHEAGENIFLLNRSKHPELQLNDLKDFWLFDDKIVLQMHYTDEGKYIGFDVITEGIEKYLQAKTLLLNKAESPVYRKSEESKNHRKPGN